MQRFGHLSLRMSATSGVFETAVQGRDAGCLFARSARLQRSGLAAPPSMIATSVASAAQQGRSSAGAALMYALWVLTEVLRRQKLWPTAPVLPDAPGWT